MMIGHHPWDIVGCMHQPLTEGKNGMKRNIVPVNFLPGDLRYEEI